MFSTAKLRTSSRRPKDYDRFPVTQRLEVESAVHPSIYANEEYAELNYQEGRYPRYEEWMSRRYRINAPRTEAVLKHFCPTVSSMDKLYESECYERQPKLSHTKLRPKVENDAFLVVDHRIERPITSEPHHGDPRRTLIRRSTDYEQIPQTFMPTKHGVKCVHPQLQPKQSHHYVKKMIYTC